MNYSSLRVYVIFFTLLTVNLLYYKWFNQNNQMEYYYHTHDSIKYHVLKYTMMFINIVTLIYSKYIYKELFKYKLNK